MKEGQSKSTQPRRNPVPSHASSQGPPQASSEGIRGEGGQFSSPLPRGCPWRVGGLDFWEVSLAEKPWKDATGRFNTASGPCFECESLFRDHENAND